MRLWQRAWRLEQRGEREAGRMLRRQMKAMPSRDPADPGYRRLRYCRYADDWVLGFTGPRQEAEEIKARIGQFLREQLKLELSPAKTLITHGRTQAARFLGYEMVVMHADDKHDHRGHRSINAGIGLKVPADVIRAKIKPYTHCGKPIRRTERIIDTDYSIVAQFQAEFRGVAEYYRLAFNRHRLGRLKYVMERSLVKTLARKYRITAPQVPPVPCRAGHRARAPPRTAGHRAPRRQEAAGRGMGRDQPGAGCHASTPQRRSPAHLEWPVRADPTAPGQPLPHVRDHWAGRGAPHPCPQRPGPQGEAGTACMGQADGSTPPQDPRRLPRLP